MPKPSWSPGQSCLLASAAGTDAELSAARGHGITATINCNHSGTFRRTPGRSLTWSSTDLNAMVFRVTFLEMCRRAWQGGKKRTRTNLLQVTFSAGRSDFSVARSQARTRADSSYESLPRAARWMLRTEAREPRFLFPHVHKTSSLVLIEQQHPKCCCHGSQACLNPGHSSNIFFLVGAELRRLDSMKTSTV